MGRQDQIQIKPLTFSKEAVNFYIRLFNEKHHKGLVYQDTSLTRSDICSWLLSIIQSDDYDYFAIFKNGRRVGHIGLAEIDQRTKTARIGCCLVNPGVGEKEQAQILEFIINLAKSKHRLKKLLMELAPKSALYSEGDFVQDVASDRLYTLTL